MNERRLTQDLIGADEKRKIAILFSSGLNNTNVLWDENGKALSEAWKKAQDTSEALKDMKSFYAFHDLQPISQSYAKLFAYLGLIEGLGVTLIDITSLLLVANHKDLHFRRGTGIMHVSNFKDLHKLGLAYKLQFLDVHGYGFIAKAVNQPLRNIIAHLNFTVAPDAKILGPDNKEIKIDEEITLFWDIVGQITNAFREKGLLAFIEQVGRTT